MFHFQAQNRQTINSTLIAVVSYKIIRPYDDERYKIEDRVSQNNTRTARPRPIFWSQTGLVLRPTVSDHITVVHRSSWVDAFPDPPFLQYVVPRPQRWLFVGTLAVAYLEFHKGGGSNPPVLPLAPSSPPSSPTHLPSQASPPLRSRPPLIQLGGLGSAVSSPSGVWGGTPAEIDFGAFYR